MQLNDSIISYRIMRLMTAFPFKLVVISLLCGFALMHTQIKSPHGVVLNEVFTLGQQQGFFTTGQPFIEIATTSSGEVRLDGYSIVVYSVFRQVEKLRVVIDLRSYGFAQNQQFAVIGDGSFQNKLLGAPMASSPGILFNDQIHALNFLSVSQQQHVVVALLYSGFGKQQKYQTFLT